MSTKIYPFNGGRLITTGDFFDDEIGNLMTGAYKKKNSSFMMKTDIEENENEYVFNVEVPGFDKKDIEITVENGYLTISAHIEKDESNKENSKFIRRERYFGSSTRCFYVGDIPEEDVKAKMDKGVLTVIVPKEEKKAPEKRRIDID